jgi:hypothetical protein
MKGAGVAPFYINLKNHIFLILKTVIFTMWSVVFFYILTRSFFMTHKTLFGLVSNETKIPHLMEKLQSAEIHEISLFKFNGSNSRGSMDEQRHAGDARHHKYDEKIQENKHRPPESRHAETSKGISEMKSISLPDMENCQCRGNMEQELRQTAQKYQAQGSTGKSCLCTSLTNQGLSDQEAHHFEAQIKSGQILICVHSPHTHDLDRAHDIFKKEGIKEISFSREKVKGHR